MITHNLKQGTPQWHAHRAMGYNGAPFFNASDAPAMLGCSPYKTRSQLLHEMHTGLTAEVDPNTQRLFDDGHRFEALARPLAEEIIEEDLYAVTGSLDRLSASFDGLTAGRDIDWEHKTLNAALRQAFDEIDALPLKEQAHAGYLLPLAYRVQMEQQLLVSDAGQCLFMASKWNGDELVEERHTWYLPDPELRQQIIDGWLQFAADLAAYVPPVPAEVKPVGKTPETLPALHVEVTGMVTASNLAQYKEHALAVFAAINRDLQTERDFADAEKIVKWCAEVESRLEAAKEHALSQTKSIDELFKTIDDIKAKARETRLDLGKLVDRRNTERKEEIVLGGKNAYQAHLDGLKAETDGLWITLPTPDFAGAIKGMRLFANMQDAVNTLLANSKIAADDSAKKIRANLAMLSEVKEYAFLFNDRGNLIGKAADDLKLLIQSRIDAHKAAEAAKEEATRERIRAEEQEKAEKAAREKMAAEQAAFDKQEQEEIARLAKLNSTVMVEATSLPTGAATAAITHSDVVRLMPTSVKQAMAPKPETPPSLRIGEIANRLGFGITAAFLRTLGFEPAGKEGASVLFHESQFPAICNALIDHIQNVVEGVAA